MNLSSLLKNTIFETRIDWLLNNFNLFSYNCMKKWQNPQTEIFLYECFKLSAIIFGILLVSNGAKIPNLQRSFFGLMILLY